MDGDVAPKKLSIAKCHTSRSINTDNVLIMLSNFNDGSSLLPFIRMWTGLVLYSDSVTKAEWWQSSGVLFESLCSFHVTLSKGGLTILKNALPSWVWTVLARVNGYKVLDRASKQAHRWRHLGILIWRVPIL